MEVPELELLLELVEVPELELLLELELLEVLELVPLPELSPPPQAVRSRLSRTSASHGEDRVMPFPPCA